MRRLGTIIGFKGVPGLMVRLNKTKPEDYMQPLDVPGGRKQFPHALNCSKNPWPGFKSRRAHL
jgi:hypothetical protein